MNQPEHELARKLVQYLDDGADQLEPRVRERLAAARRNALSRYREQPAPVFGLAWAGQAALWLTEHRLHSARLLIAAAALVLATAGIVYWQSTRLANGVTDVDFYLLTDELPINAYLDKGFDSWLKRSSR
ncbi:MAG: DUF3619 family protein [Burkholderiales bacterium]